MEPWISRGIFKSIKTKQKLYLTEFVHGNSNEKQIFKRHANQLNRIKVASKNLFYQSIFEKSTCNSQLMWRTIKSPLSSSSSSSLPQTLKLDGSVTTDPVLMAEEFNNYFSKVGALFADKIESSKENTFKIYMSKRISSSLFLYPTNPAEVFNIISSLKTSKSSGYDYISSFILKSAIKVLVFPLTHLFNCLFKLDMFPDCLKVSKVLAVYKSGEKSEVYNYRPIFILSSISKVLKKLIHIRSSTFLNKHSILLPTQYGLRANHSTIHALLDVITSSYDNINNSKFTALLLLDLRKAFDTVNHNILLNKLERYGIHGVAHKLFSFFLSNICQYVIFKKQAIHL